MFDSLSRALEGLLVVLRGLPRPLARRDHFIDDPELLRLLGREVRVPVHDSFNSLDVLARVAYVNLVELLARLQDLLGDDGDVGGLALGAACV